jgi:adenylate cyclase
MNYYRLPQDYPDRQFERIRKVLARIDEGDADPQLGRVIPDDGTLVIGTGRALELAVLFLDISRFSSRPADTAEDQHLLLQELNVFFTEMVQIARDYGGTVEKNTGDGLMAYFEENGGDPPAPACHRAMAAALTMMATHDEILEPLAIEYGRTPLRFRIGIDYGKVTVARVGAKRGFNSNVAIGTAANLASKMLSVAHPGDIVLGDAVRRGLPPRWGQHTVYAGPSGFEYTASRVEYPLYRYTGRWVVGGAR